jgi:hypothetical protein
LLHDLFQIALAIEAGGGAKFIDALAGICLPAFCEKILDPAQTLQLRCGSIRQWRMADYYPLISRAIAALDNKSKEARRAVYDRARAALANQFQNDPAFAFERERRALEDAINKVEADTILSEGTRNEPGSTNDIEPPGGQGQVLPRSTGEVPTGVLVLGIVLWLILFGLGGLILWQNLSH